MDFDNKNIEIPTDPQQAHEDDFRHVSNIPVIPQLSVALGLLVAVFAVTYIGVASTAITKTEPEDDVRINTVVTPPTEYTDENSDPFEDIALEAKSAFVWDIKNDQVLFNKNGDTALPLASVTKLMTALIASELLDTQSTVSISLEALRTEGDSGLLDGEEFTAQNIIDLTLITSSNDGAVALSAAAASIVAQDRDPEEIFVHAMNLRAEELGLSKTTFTNSTGLDLDETNAGAYGSARDIAHLMSYVITHARDAIELTNTELTRVVNNEGAYHIAQNTNSIVDDIEGLIASKTGYTELAGGNLVIAFNAGLNRPIVIAVLGSSYQGRFKDTQDLVERTKLLIAQE